MPGRNFEQRWQYTSIMNSEQWTVIWTIQITLSFTGLVLRVWSFLLYIFDNKLQYYITVLLINSSISTLNTIITQKLNKIYLLNCTFSLMSCRGLLSELNGLILMCWQTIVLWAFLGFWFEGEFLIPVMERYETIENNAGECRALTALWLTG